MCTYRTYREVMAEYSFMKKVIYLLLPLILISCSQKETNDVQIVIRNDLAYEVNSDQPFTGMHVTYHNNGQIKSKLTYKDGLQDLKEYYYESGQLASNFIFKNGDLYEYEYYYSDGMIEEKKSAVDNESYIVESFYQDGQIEFRNRFKYKNDEKVSQHWYYPNGQLEYFVIYSDEGRKIIEAEYTESGEKRY